MTRPALTDEQAKQMTEDFQRLFDLACLQLSEHKTWLKNKIAEMQDTALFNLDGPGPMQIIALWHQVESITLEVVRPEEMVTALVKEGDAMVAKPTISVVYDYPDELFAFLTGQHATEELRASMTGAHTQDLDKQAITITRLPDTAGAVKAP